MNTTMTDAARRHRAVTVNLVSRGTALALLACGMVAFLGVWLLEARGGVLRPIDRFGYPAASLGMAAMVVALTLRRVSVAASLRGACVVVCTYFVLSVGMAAYIDPASAVSLYDVGTISPWLLMLEVLLYATFPVRTATGLAVATLSLVMTPLWFSNKGATVDELLLNNALANIICIAIMQALARQWAALVRATPRERLPDADANADVEITAAELARRRAADLARLLDEARQAGQDARTVAAELRTMLETFPGFVGRLDAAGRYTYVNPPLAAMFGRTPADIVGRQPRTLPGVRRITESVERAAPGQPQIIEVEVTRPDGERRHLLLTLFAVPPVDGDGETRWYHVGVDITGERRAREALDEARRVAEQQAAELERLALVARSTASAVLVTGRDLRAVWVNEGFVRLTGYALDDLHQARLCDLLTSDATDPGAVQALRDAAAEGRACRVELMNRARDGRDYWVDIELQPLRGADGDVSGFMALQNDVSARRTAEDAMRNSIALVDAMFDAVPMPLTLKDASGHYLRVNRAAANEARRPADDLVGRTMIEIAGDEGDVHDLHDRRVIETGEIVEFDATHRISGSERVFLVRKAPVRDDRGRVMAVVSAAVDLTDQRRIRDALEAAKLAAEEASHAKSAFLATMSHEIRTPMNGVLGMTELLWHTRLDEQQQTTVRTIGQSARALLRIIDDILDFSKAEAGRLVLETGDVDLAALTEEVCESLVPIAAERGVDLVVHATARAPSGIRSDAVRWRQIVNNLVGNAIKFSGSTEGVEVPGRVAVTLDGDADHVELTVDDNGIGMDAVTRDRLFEPFMQAEASTTRRFGGTGLGLAITRRLVDLMHGDIEVTSAPERGSRFRVRVPVETVARATPAPAPDLTGVQCVIVTDDILPVAIVREWLAGAGASIVEVPDVAAAAARLAHLPAPRVVILRTAVIADVLATLGTDADPGVLVVARGRRGGARQVAPRAAALDWLRRSALQQAVAALSGRASPIVSLPVARETVRAASPTFASDIGRAQAEGRLILVAEDDAINRAVISRQLAVLGHAAVVAEDGEVALDLWRSGRFALLLTDLHMPVIDGYALTRRIRAEEAARVGGRRTPVVMLTANAMKGEEDRAREAGVDDYLTKPVPLDGLGEVIARWLPAAPGATGAADTGPRDADPASPLLDLDVLRALVGGDEDAVRDLLGEYARSVGRLASELADALRAGDGPQAGALAHKLKSASQSVGAVALARTCAALERDRTGADPAEQPHVLEHFEALVRDTLTRVHRQLGELG